MIASLFFRAKKPRAVTKVLATLLSSAIVVSTSPALAQLEIPPVPGDDGLSTEPLPLPTPVPANGIFTPRVPRELPTEIEMDLSLDSLKQAPLWNELQQLLDAPYDPLVRRRSYLPQGCSYQPGAALACDDSLMPELRTWPLGYNVHLDQPLRLRASDGEISWDMPGPLYGPADDDITTLEPIIGALVVDADNNLVVSNPDANANLPPNGTIVAVPGFNDAGQAVDVDGNVILSFDKPVNENDFVVNRDAAILLGKALFWDMQVGSDGVQACGSCHFHAGVDNRTQNQLNPGHLGGDTTLQVRGPNEAVEAADFPFRRLGDPDLPSEGDPRQTVIADANDVMSSMGVIFRNFVDIPSPGPAAFIPGTNPPVLLPDIGEVVSDPIPVFEGVRRVEPRNTPTMHAAAFNFDSFWDGRARHDFNGGSVFGPSDPQFHIFIDDAGALTGATNGHIAEEMDPLDPMFAEPCRIRFSSLGSQAVGPPLSDFEMSFLGRNWPKIGKKLLQEGVTPLASQLVDVNDSVLGPYSNQNTTPGMPGLNITYAELIRLAFRADLWSNVEQHLSGAADPSDPFDTYVLTPQAGPADPTNTNAFTQMEANFSLFFGLSVQLFEQILIPDDTPFDRFMDANPLAGYGFSQPGEKTNTPPEHIPPIVAVPGFGANEIFGLDIFAGANLTKGLGLTDPAFGAQFPEGRNPNFRSARCALCHFGPEFGDHSTNVVAGIVKSDTEFEWPAPGEVEPIGQLRYVTGHILAEELEENLQDGVEVENRNMLTVDDPSTPGHDGIVAEPTHTAFQDNGIYNIGLRPTAEDIGRGGDDPFGMPLSLASLAMKNLAGADFEPADDLQDYLALGPIAVMPNFDPQASCGEASATCSPEMYARGGGLFELTGADQRVNPGLELEPAEPMLPSYLAPWVNNMPAAELHPELDEVFFVPNTVTEPPFAEFGEWFSQTDVICGTWSGDLDPPVLPARWGSLDDDGNFIDSCPNIVSGVHNNMEPPLNGTWPFPNRVARNGAFKVPHLRNIELTGPYFHTGSYLTLRQVVDFYVRGGDFPLTNAEDRDPNLVNIHAQAFAFGPNVFVDAVNQHAELSAAEQEEAITAIIHFLLALTDDRVRFERAPFDHPEIFVPVDGTAPDNIGGRDALLADPRFLQVAAVGAAGRAEPLAGFIGTSRVQGDPGLDHFDRQPTPPLAADLAFAAFADLPLEVAAPGVLGAASDINGDPLSAILVSGPVEANATLTFERDGSFRYTYTSELQTPIVDTFTYKVSDGAFESREATVTITTFPRYEQLIAVVAEAAGASCAFGGQRIDVGLDINGDGQLGDGEIGSSHHVCNGAPGSDGQDGLSMLVAINDEPAGANCAAGGKRVDHGFDVNENGILDANEASSTTYLCHEPPQPPQAATLVSVTPEPPGSNCPNGGSRIEAGPDCNSNEVLEAAEVTSTSYICNGVDGTNGVDAVSSLVAVAEEPSGAECPSGGQRIDVGLDSNHNGVLDAQEVAGTSYVCQSDPGASSNTAGNASPGGSASNAGCSALPSGHFLTAAGLMLGAFGWRRSRRRRSGC